MKPKLILRKFLMLAGLGVAALGTVGTMPAQDSNSAATAASQITAVPPLVRYAGNAAHRAGDTVEAVFRIYSAQQGGEPVWSETQRVAIGADGKYSILLGAGTDGGIPAQVFAAGEARWLGVSIERAPEQPRTALVSVAYAMKAVDADSVGGLAASELVTRAQLSSVARQMAAQATQLAGPAPQVTPSGAGTANYLPLWTSATTLANSAIYQSGTAASPTLGVFTTKPFVQFDVASISNFRYRLQLYTGQASTPATGVNSPMLQFYASSYLANGARPIQQTFAWQAVAQNNNTSSPSANLELLYSILGQTPTPTGLSIEPSGVINFAPYQTYPGTITSVEPGIGLTGGGTSGNVMLTVDTGLVPLMSSQNSFTALQKFTSGLNVTGVGTVTGALNVNGTASFSSNTAGSTVSVMGGASSAGPVLWVSGGQAGVLGAGSANGLLGTSTAAAFGNGTGSGVQGTGPSGITGYGVQYGAYATASGAAATGVYAKAPSGVGLEAIGGRLGAAVSGMAVDGTGLVVTGSGIGVNASASGTTGIGTKSVSASKSGLGVYAMSNFPSKVSAYMMSYGGPFAGIGVWADTGASLEDTSWVAPLMSTADNSISAVVANNSNGAASLFAINYGSGPRTNAVPVIHATGANGDCILNTDGDSICTGAHKAAVSIDGGAHQVEMYAVHSAENWFEDFGTARLEHGVALVKIDPAFAGTINGEMDYHVFPVPQGDCEGLYVTNKTATSFEVHELRGGSASIAFDYRITARRAGHETERMRDVTEQMKADAPRKMPAKANEGELR